VPVSISVDLARKFGLSAEQFGENLRDQYQRHDVEQDPAEPLEIAEQYIAGYVCVSVCLSVCLSSDVVRLFKEDRSSFDLLCRGFTGSGEVAHRY